MVHVKDTYDTSVVTSPQWLLCRLTIHEGKAKMSFFREFVLRLDGCCDMEGVFLRTGPADSSICSIMSSSQSASRPSTTLSLPRIVQPLSVRSTPLYMHAGEVRLLVSLYHASHTIFIIHSYIALYTFLVNSIIMLQTIFH